MYVPMYLLGPHTPDTHTGHSHLHTYLPSNLVQAQEADLI